ncbi:MAG: O-antigen ligase family protein [Patescibacteria group bacterium]
MTYRGLEKFYLWSIHALLFIVPFLPLYVSGTTYFPYITGRNFAFRIIVEIAFIFWLGLIALNKEYRPRFSKLYAAVFMFAAVVFVADLFGVNFYKSFWANYERMEGYVMILHMVLFFTILSSVFRQKAWALFANAIVVGSVAVGAYAFVQHLGLIVSLQGGARVDGTIGNPAYLAAYLLLSFTIALVLFWNSSQFLQKYIYGIVMAFQLLIIYFTATRGVLLGLLGGGILFLILFLWSGRAGRYPVLYKKIAIGILLGLLILPLLFWAIKDSAFVKESPVLSRFGSISLSDKTIQSRFTIWSMAWEGVKEHPLLGWGQENYNLIFNKYYKPELWKQEPWFDRSHNIIFDWLSNAGILGLASYLWLYVAAIGSLLYAYRKERIGNLTILTFISGFAGYLFQNLFVFDNFNSYFIFFSFLGYINFVSMPDSSEMEGNTRKDINNGIKNMPTSVVVFTIAAIIGAFVVYQFNIRALDQSTDLIRTFRVASAAGNATKDVLASYRKTLAHDSFGNAETREQFMQYASNVAGNNAIPAEERRLVLGESIKEMEKQIEASPNDIRYMMFLAGVGYTRMAQFDASYIQKAEDEYLKILEISPKKQQAYFGLIQLYLNVQRLDKAYEYAEKVKALDPTFPDAHMISAIIDVYSGRFGEADNEVALYEATGKYYPQDIINMASAYIGAKKYEQAVHLYSILTDRFPDNPQYHANLAAVYATLGMKNEARAEAEEAGRLDPENYGKETESFIQSLP